MARKRRAPPPPPPPQESDTDAEESPPKVVSQAADPSDGEPASDVDVNAFQIRPVSHPSGSEADESSESEREVLEPVQKKAAAAATTTNCKAAVPADKKRPAPEPAPSGIAKRTRAHAGKAEPEAAPAGKGKNANAEREKVAPEATPAAKGKKANDEREKAAPEATPAAKGKKANAEREKAASEATTPAAKGKKANAEQEKAAPEATTPAAKGKKRAKKPLVKAENPGIDPSPAKQRWSTEDLVKILEAMGAHVKATGAPPKTDVLIETLRGRLDRKDCSYTDMYEKVRNLKIRYQKAVGDGVVPSGEDDLQMYNLSEEIWGEKAKAMRAAAAASQNDPAVTKTKKGLAKKESEVPNQSGDTQKVSKKGHVVQLETDKDGKSKLSKEDIAAASTCKGKKLRNGKQEPGKDAKSGTSKEAAAATQCGDDVMKRKGKGKMPTDTMDIDLLPKEASTDCQSRGAGTEEETHQEETEIGASARGTHRSFDELEGLYPCLAGYMKKMAANHICGETMMRGFGFIGDERANALESKIKALQISEVKAQFCLQGIQKEIFKCLF